MNFILFSLAMMIQGVYCFVTIIAIAAIDTTIGPSLFLRYFVFPTTPVKFIISKKFKRLFSPYFGIYFCPSSERNMLLIAFCFNLFFFDSSQDNIFHKRFLVHFPK